MTGKQLKNSILQWAIQGKLVPQDPNDEPASVLLERIREEKARLIKEKKIKKPKNESIIYRGDDNSYYEKFADGTVKCIDDEIPFEIPSSWQWERWGNISHTIQYGYNASALEGGDVRMVRISDIQNGKVDWKSVPFCKIPQSDIGTYRLQKNDILFARTGGTVGKSFLVEEVPYESIYAGYLIRTQYSIELEAQYLKKYMESSLYWEQLQAGTIATAQPNCNGNTLGRMLIPIPPKFEQKRIVAKIALLQPFIERFCICNAIVTDLNNSLSQELRKSFLQEAIKGRLVSQSPDDEPASVLLERIRAEKGKLIKEKKIKKDKVESFIFRGDDNCYYEQIGKVVHCIQDEIPFEIPQSWEWARVSTVLWLNPKNEAQDETRAAFIPMEKINAGFGSSFSFDNVAWGTIRHGYTHFADGDVAFAKITPCFQNRKSAIFKGLPNGIGAGTTELRILRPFADTFDRFYLLYFLESPYFIDEATFKGTANQQRIVVGYLENKLIPVPPLAEQRRIVVKIEPLFKMLN